MGADGGLCWLRITDRKTYDELTSWFSWSYLNRSAYAYRGEFARDIVRDEIIADGDYEEGAYGTDTDYDLRWLIEFADWCWSTEDCQSDYIRDWTIQDLIDSLMTEPCGFKNIYTIRSNPWDWNKDYWDCLGAFGECLILHIESISAKDIVDTEQGGTTYNWPGPFDKSITLREWGERMSKSIAPMSYMSEENWT